MKMLKRSDLPAVLGSFGALLLLAGCNVGPDYQRPSALGTNAMPAAFTGKTAANGIDWKAAQPSAHVSRGPWWEIFGDPELNRLETLASSNNQQLVAAMANFEQARALVKVSRADFFPQISTAPSVNRVRTSAHSQTGSSQTFNTFSVPIDASWEIDLWGRVRRSVEGASARMTAAADDLESAKLAIQAEVAIDYFTLCSLDAQRVVLEETVTTYQHALNLTQKRRQSGIATEYDVSLAETQLKSTQAQLPAVNLQAANLRHALAALCGQPAPGFVISVPQTTPTAPPTVPVEVPSELLEHRPDIAAAERRMAAANADIGVATAAFYPSLMLNGFAGYQSIGASTLFDWPSRVWSIGPSLQMPLFTGGRNRAQLAFARSGYDGAVANYRQTVLSAFQDVEDQLAAQHLLALQYDSENAALLAARRTLEISNTRYKGGVITYLDVAIAQSAALGHEQTVIALRASRLSAAVSLIKSIGAGWSTGEEHAAAAPPQSPKQSGLSESNAPKSQTALR
jgi:NodT family efflux transporter outer membrane factor (OMF) lipoprotein